MEIKVHPFDLNYQQIIKHRDSTYRQAKGVIRCQASKPADATVKEVLESVTQLLNLPQKVVNSIQHQFNIDTLNSKLTFTDFLTLLQKEAFFRDALSEAQMYKLSACRLQYANEVNLITTQQLEIMKQMKRQRQYSDSSAAQQQQNVPNFSYLIEHMIMFEYQGQQHIMVAFENKSVQVIDFKSGNSLHEFNFNERPVQAVQVSEEVKKENRYQCSQFIQHQMTRQVRRLGTVKEPELTKGVSYESQHTRRVSQKRLETQESQKNIMLKSQSSKLKSQSTSNKMLSEDVIRKRPFLGDSNPFEAQNSLKMKEHTTQNERTQRNYFTELRKDLNQMQPKSARTTTNVLATSQDPSICGKQIQKTLDELGDKRRNVVNALGRLREKERIKSKGLDQIILLNRATEKIESLTQSGNGKQDFNLVQAMEDEEAEAVTSGKVCSSYQPLYRSLFPEWGRLNAKYLTERSSQDVVVAKNDKKLKNQKNSKKAYPMCMDFYKPLNLCIFALVAEIAIYSVSQGGNKKVFNHIASHKIDANNEFIPTCLEVAQHKVTGKILVCLAVQSSKLNKNDLYDHYIVVYEFDQFDKYKVTELVRQKSSMAPITKILYRPQCGLIMACFMGYIELFDSIEFQSKGKWDNQINVAKNNADHSTKQQVKNKQNQDLDKEFEISKKVRPLTTKGQQKVNLNEMFGQQAGRPTTSKAKPKDAGKQRKLKHSQTFLEEQARKKCVATIDCLDYSVALDLIAFGGIQGKIGILDSSTLSFKGMYDAHGSEITGLYFYDSQMQMISMAIDGEVSLWDAQKMQILQTVRNKSYMHGASQVNSSYFCKESGTLLLATSKVFMWQMKEDYQTRINIEQQHAVARDYLTQYKEGLQRCGVLSKNTTSEQEIPQVQQRQTRQVNLSQLLQNKQSYVDHIFDEENLASKFSIQRNPQPKVNCNILPSSKTEIAGFFLNPLTLQMFTVDVNCLVRMWCMKSGECLRSYPLEIVQENDRSGDEVSSAFKHKFKIQFCQLDPTYFNLLVAYQGGVVQIHNIYSGAILFNKSSDETLNIGQEVTNVKWFGNQSTYWFVCTCWEGQVVFFSHPLQQKGREYLTCKKVISFHKRDVTCVDATTKNYLVTGSIDNLICFWNTFNCQINKQIPIPKTMVSTLQGNTICALKYPNPSTNELLMVFMNEGEVFCLDTVNESFIQQKSGSYNLGTVKKYSIVDLVDGYCLAVSERGQGSLHMVTTQHKSVRAHTNTSLLQTMMELQYSFQVSTKKLENHQTVTQVKVMPQQDKFIVAQLDGQIHFKNLRDGSQICYLNDPNWTLKLTVTEKRPSNN